MSTTSTTKPAAPLRCRGCGNEDGPFTKDGLCEDCESRTGGSFPYRGGHDNPCAYAAGISSTCTCGGPA